MIKYVPNILTCARLLLTVIFLIMLVYSPQVEGNQRWLFIDVIFVLFLIAGLTDIVDGKIARQFNATSKLGRILDPLADKILVCGSFAVFAYIGQPTFFALDGFFLHIILWLVFFIITTREIYVTVVRQIAESKGISFPAVFSGKIKMFLQSFAIGTVLIKYAHVHKAAWAQWFTLIVYLLMLTVTILSGLHAHKRMQQIREKQPARSPV